ncbi:MAG: DUF937 domain-containing protein [Dehalococcoidia bacterium]
MNQTGTLLQSLLTYNDGAVVKQIAGKFGLPEDQAQSAIASMLPALSRGFERNIQSPDGLTSLENALQSGNHEQYVDNPVTLAEPTSIEDGNAILGHVLGSKDVSRNVAGFASQQTGLDSSILKQMLPMIAAAAMGILTSTMASGGKTPGVSPQPASAGGGSGDVLGMLTGFLDANKDGSMLDDLLNLGQKFFQQPRA